MEPSNQNALSEGNSHSVQDAYHLLPQPEFSLDKLFEHPDYLKIQIRYVTDFAMNQLHLGSKETSKRKRHRYIYIGYGCLIEMLAVYHNLKPDHFPEAF